VFENADWDLAPSKDNIRGIYMTGLCNGVREILNDYSEVVAALEMEILQNVYMALNNIKAEVEPFRIIFNVLLSLIEKVRYF